MASSDERAPRDGAGGDAASVSPPTGGGVVSSTTAALCSSGVIPLRRSMSSMTARASSTRPLDRRNRGDSGQAASPPQQEDHWKRGDDGGDSPADFWVGRDDDWCDDSGEYIAEGEEADCPGDEFAADAGREELRDIGGDDRCLCSDAEPGQRAPDEQLRDGVCGTHEQAARAEDEQGTHHDLPATELVRENSRSQCTDEVSEEY